MKKSSLSSAENLKRIAQLYIKKYLLFLLLIPIVILSQLYLLEPHLQYGLSDLDDGSTYGFKQFAKESSNVISFFIDSYKVLGVYAHQYYYLGILEYFFGDNFVAFHQVTHIFKILATLAAYPLFFVLSGSTLIAFISVFILSFSHSAVGSIQLVVTGSDYPAMLVFVIFLSIYFYIVKNNINKIQVLLLALAFFGAALVFSTERVYPVIFLILIYEGIRILKYKEQKVTAIKRVLVLFSPIFVAILIKPVFMGLLVPNSSRLIEAVSKGRLDYLLVPFIALTSTILPPKFWHFLAVAQTNDLTRFINSLFMGILPILLIITLFLGWILSKKILRFNLIVILITALGIIAAYYFGLNHKDAAVGPAILGFYILGLTVGFLIEWIKTKDNNYFGLFFAPLTAFLFILNMWFATMDRDLVFAGVHRYLIIASIFISLFLGNLIVLIYLNFLKKKFPYKLGFVIPVVMMILLIYFSVAEINNYFKSDLASGYANKDKILMRKQILPYLNNLSEDNPRLFYLDIHTDSTNTHYYGNAITSGFDSWTLWLPNINFNRKISPNMISDVKTLKSSVMDVNGEKVIIYNGVTYKLDNFYALQFIGKKTIDITDKIKRELELE